MCACAQRVVSPRVLVCFEYLFDLCHGLRLTDGFKCIYSWAAFLLPPLEIVISLILHFLSTDGVCKHSTPHMCLSVFISVNTCFHVSLSLFH